MSNRKRNRWGEAVSSSPPPPPPPPPRSTVSNDDVVKALLDEATARQRKKDEENKQQKQANHRMRDRRHQNDNKRAAPVGRQVLPENDSYYGPAESQRKEVKTSNLENTTAETVVPKEKPNFGLSGALAQDEEKGNVFKGVILKFSEPPEARAPNTQWRLYVFKGEDTVETLHISKQSAYLLGRNEDIADIPLRHASCSSQHAVLQYRCLPDKETGKLHCRPYLMDLESTNGSFINGIQIDSARYYQLKKGDVLKFGASTREYVLLTANSTSIE